MLLFNVYPVDVSLLRCIYRRSADADAADAARCAVDGAAGCRPRHRSGPRVSDSSRSAAGSPADRDHGE